MLRIIFSEDPHVVGNEVPPYVKKNISALYFIVLNAVSEFLVKLVLGIHRLIRSSLAEVVSQRIGLFGDEK